MSTILLVDANREDVDRLSCFLKRSGHNVIVRAEGFSALTVIRNGTRVDAVIAETHLADMDGYKFLGGVRKHAPNVPVIVLSDADSVEEYLQCLNLGVYEFVNKPVAERTFEQIVSSALRQADAGAAGPARSDGRC